MSHTTTRQLLVSLDDFLVRRQFINANEGFSTTSSIIPTNTSTDIQTIPSNLPLAMPPHSAKTKRRPSRIPVATDAWKKFPKRVPFLAVPPEIHLKIFELLHPVEAVCLSVVK